MFCHECGATGAATGAADAHLQSDASAASEARPAAARAAAARPAEEAENDLRRSAQRAKRRAALAKLLPDCALQGWTGTLESLDTDARGNAYITIAPDGAEGMTIVTWNNALADAGTHSMIRSGSALYSKLAGIRAGARVIVRGTFAASEVDHIAAGSLTETRSMTTPAFVMVFSDVTEQE